MKKRVLKYLSPYTGIFLAALGCMVLYGASDGVVPFLIKNVLDKVFQAQDASLLKLILVALVVFAIVRAAADFGQQYLMSKVGHNIVRDIRNEINRHFLKLSPSYFIRHSTADLIARTTSDVLLVRGLLTDSVASIIRDTIRVLALLVSALYLDPTLALLSIVVLPFGFFPVYRISRQMRKLSRRGQQEIGSLTATMQESVMGARVVRLFGREDFEIERYEAENERLNRTFVKSEVIRALTGPVNEVLASLAIGGVILYGGYSVINGVRTQGSFIAFLVSVFLLYDPIKRLTRVSSTVAQGLAGAERIFEVLDTKPDIISPLAPQALGERNDLELRAVSFTYPGQEHETLSQISLKIPEGKKIAIVGFSGAGKSTLIDLLPRFIDPTEGAVLIGGVDVKTASLVELRKRIAVVGQHTFLFHDTVYNNIAYGLEHATEEQVRNAARAAYALDFIESLPLGFQSIVGEGGHSLSGGERQRIAIARAILKNSPILILDEATASLDNRSEREVQSALDSLEQGRTTIVIAHRLSTIQNADLIVVLKDGQIVELGKHDELLAQKAEFFRLHALQFREVAA
jgi:subfamily B ATP-binding cassette protein MsbA